MKDLALLSFSIFWFMCRSELAGAFSHPSSLPTQYVIQRRNGGKSLGMSNIFDGFSRFFSPENHGDDDDTCDDHDDDDDFLGSSRIISLPVESIKPGGLRLFLMFYLMGEQNTPEKGSWKIDQPTTDEYAVDIYYHDRTAVLMIRLTENMITIDRMGSTPSTSYIMQEAVIVDGILDELQRMVSEGGIARKDRLILLKDENAIVKAREALAFG